MKILKETNLIPSTDGTTGQVLTLADDGTTEWKDQTGGGGSVNLTGYAKESYVDEKIGNIETALDGTVAKQNELIDGEPV